MQWMKTNCEKSKKSLTLRVPEGHRGFVNDESNSSSTAAAVALMMMMVTMMMITPGLLRDSFHTHTSDLFYHLPSHSKYRRVGFRLKLHLEIKPHSSLSFA